MLIRALGFTFTSIPLGIVRNKMPNLDSLRFRMKTNDLSTVSKIIDGISDLKASFSFFICCIIYLMGSNVLS